MSDEVAATPEPDAVPDATSDPTPDPTPDSAPPAEVGDATVHPRVEVPPLVAGNGAFLATLLLVATGFAYTAFVPEHWLRGVLVAAGGFLLGAALRLGLPERSAGMLKIRGKVLDVLGFGTVAVLIVTVGVLLPH